ncbi:MAG: DUF4231 domain-containing protein [Acidobacteriota bacterium]
MTDEKFEEYLNERYRPAIGYYESQATTNKRMYNRFQWSVIIISAVMPVLVVSTNQTDYFRWAAAGLSVLLAIGTSALKAFKFQENWMNFRQIAETLKQERYFYEAEIGAYAAAPDKLALFVDRVESLISRENAIWVNVHQQKEEKSKER